MSRSGEKQKRCSCVSQCLCLCLCLCLWALCLCCVVWCGVVLWCGGVMWCGVVWCGVVWCGAVWCGVLWCGVVWCGSDSKGPVVFGSVSYTHVRACELGLYLVSLFLLQPTKYRLVLMILDALSLFTMYVCIYTCGT